MLRGSWGMKMNIDELTFRLESVRLRERKRKEPVIKSRALWSQLEPNLPKFSSEVSINFLSSPQR
jgi:hypothetical protein